MTPAPFSITALSGVPAVRPGGDLPAMIMAAMAANGLRFADGDILVLAQKIVSKAEGRQVALDAVEPGDRAVALASQCCKDARLVELILSESEEVMRVRTNVLIVRHRLGLVLANAGIDQSNVGIGDGYASGPQALLLPVDPDASAARLREEIRDLCGARIAVLIIDSLGRAWRMGTIGTAIGVAGIPALVDLRGRPDLNGRLMESSELGLADEIAAAASLAMGQGAEGCPVVVLRGFGAFGSGGTAVDLVRPVEQDLFP